MKTIAIQFGAKSRGAILLTVACLMTGCLGLSQSRFSRSVVGLESTANEMDVDRGMANRQTVFPASFRQPSQPTIPGNRPGTIPGFPASFSNRQGVVDPRVAYPDEYLVDGGDRAAPIHYDDQHRLGLDTEDTVVEYYDHEGKREVKSTNRVAIYAPRFAALRSIGSPSDGTAIEKLGSLDQKNMGTELYNRDAVAAHHDNMRVNSARMRLRPSALGSESLAMSADKTLKLNLDHNIQSSYLNLQFLRTGRIQQTEEAMLASAIDSASVWSRSLNPVVTGSISHAQEVQAKFYGAEIVGVDESHKRKGDLRIIKLADKKTAQPGDVITFTIRYDNLGDRELKHIRVVDNLTPRLEFVADSASSDRDGDLVLEDNGEGSLVLKFEIEKPLKGHEGGVITFKAKVR